MAAVITEDILQEKAIRYLKTQWGEDTVRMKILGNSTEDGTGELHVDCTVSIGGSESDWTKWFQFQDGEVVDMRWKMR